MKNIIYILTATILFTSCRSIDKMIESGNYEQAFRYGVDKLRGKKNKKTKYVKGLEKAFKKLNEEDLYQIKKLEMLSGSNTMDRVVSIYNKMEARQTYLMPLLPLVSEDGYIAEFTTKDYSKDINQAMVKASNKHYDIANEYLIRAKETGNKKTARQAYNSFKDAQQYFQNYRDTYSKRDEAFYLGQTIILVEPYTAGSNIAFDHTEEILSLIDINYLNSKWEKFITHDDGNYDYVATIEVTNILPGKEVERYKSYTETKEIIDGKIPVKDTKGRVVKDTLGNIIYTEKKKTVTAYVEELLREKIAQMNGKIVIVDAITNSHIRTVPISVTHEFQDYSCNVRGDKRALNDTSKKRIKKYCSPFPTDYQMTSDLAHVYKQTAEQIISRESFI